MINELNEENIVNNLIEMIAIDSTTGKEENFADWIADYLRKLGFDPKQQKVEGKRKNIYAIYSFSDNGPFLTLNGHLDTIPVTEGWTTNPFRAEFRGNYLYGLGAWDMKSGIAVLLETFRVLVSHGEGLKGTLAFSVVIDEEAYSLGAKALLSTEIANSDAIIIAEPWYGDQKRPTFLGSTGKLLYEIVAHGKAAHGLNPEEGINAIDEMAKLLIALNNLVMISHPLFGRGNTCVLKINGGYKKYSVIVPEECKAIINRLIVPGESINECILQIKELINSLKLKSEFRINIKDPSYDAYTVSKDESIIQSFIDSYHEITNLFPSFKYHKMITDANIFSGLANIPTLIFGPKGGNIHSANEYVEINSLKTVTEIYVSTIMKYLNTNAY